MKRNEHFKNKLLFSKLKIFIILIFILSIFLKLSRKKQYNLIKNKCDYKKVIITNPTGKLYWNGETSIQRNEIREEIKKLYEANISFENETDFIKREEPKVSVIITLYNQEKYIKTIYACIQKQELKDIEIIFVDDASTDNSSMIVKELMKKDKRIVYLKNNENKLTYYSRNRGILSATGEYILIIDPDDLLLNNILIKSYETAKKYCLDMVQFYILIGRNEYASIWKKVKYKDGFLLSNSEIRNIFYHSMSRNLADKLIRREIYVKSVEFMPKDLYNEDYHINDDDTAFLGLVHFAERYAFLEQIGYFYKLKPLGTVVKEDPNIVFRSLFNILKYFYLKSDNNTLEKSFMAYDYFEKKIKKPHEKYIPELTEGFKFYISVLDLYLNSIFFNDDQKRNLNDFKKKLLDRKCEVKRFNDM